MLCSNGCGLRFGRTAVFPSFAFILHEQRCDGFRSARILGVQIATPQDYLQHCSTPDIEGAFRGPLNDVDDAGLAGF